MSDKLNFPYYNDKNQLVSGAAAFSHFVYTECGGITQYNEMVAEAYLKEWIKNTSSTVNTNLTKAAHKQRFKKIG